MVDNPGEEKTNYEDFLKMNKLSNWYIPIISISRIAGRIWAWNLMRKLRKEVKKNGRLHQELQDDDSSDSGGDDGGG